MKRDEYIAANRAAWDEVQPVHAARNLERLRAGFATPGFTCLEPAFQVERLARLGLAGKAVAQLACNNGRELLSLRNLGAGRCTGFDLSGAFIAEARELARIAGLDVEFVACDAYAIPPEHDGAYDLVYLSVGALCWMPDLPAFFAVAARLLAPGGRVFVCETHPFLDVFEQEAPGATPVVRHSYFATEPERDTQGLDYYGRTTYAARPNYWFPHTLADVLAALLGSGLAIESFEEFPDEIGNRLSGLAALPTALPASYILVGAKRAP